MGVRRQPLAAAALAAATLSAALVAAASPTPLARPCAAHLRQSGAHRSRGRVRLPPGHPHPRRHRRRRCPRSDVERGRGCCHLCQCAPHDSRTRADVSSRRYGGLARYALTHPSPLTTHPSPLTPHHSPLTTHHSPLTTHHSFCVSVHFATGRRPAPGEEARGDWRSGIVMRAYKAPHMDDEQVTRRHIHMHMRVHMQGPSHGR